MKAGSARGKKFVLTEESLNKYLDLLDADRGLAAEKYVQLHRKLEMSFARRGRSDADELADESIDRTVKQIEAGTQIQTTVARYTMGVADRVFLEALKKPRTVSEPESLAARDDDADSLGKAEVHDSCLEKCLKELPPESRRLVLLYYQSDKRLKIENRKALAEELELSPNALAIRVCRIRPKLEKCVTDCLKNRETDDMN